MTTKSKTVAGLLAIFLGSFGVHRFYLRSYRLGIIYAVFFWTLIPGILGVIEGFRYLLMDHDDFVSKYSPDTTPVKADNSRAVPNTETNREESELEEPSVELSFDIESTVGSSHVNEKEKKNQSTKTWVSPGQDITVSGYSISGGMVYVGSELAGVQGYRGTDACLINPSLDANSTRSDPNGTRMFYWPSYSDIDPGCRATYLQWLANGRRDPDFDIGYVFLFFYGLERRILFDAQYSSEARSEIPHLINEVEELLEVYSGEGSFQSYATQLLDMARARYNPEALATAPPPKTAYRHELPLGLRVQIGRQLVNGEQIDPELAYRCFQQAPNSYLRTPAERCEDAFKTLFLVRYVEKFNGGLSREPNNTPLTVSYGPASRSLPPQDDIEIDDLPDISALSAPQKKLQELANECCDELDSYSRHVGKTQDRDTLEALSLLPKPVLDHRKTDSLTNFLQTIESELGSLDVVETELDLFLEYWFTQPNEKVRERDLRRLAKLLEGLGFGIEPDVRFSTPSRGWGDPAVLFRLSSEMRFEESDISESIRLIQKLAVKVVLANDEVAPEQTEYLAENLGTFLELNEVDRIRLDAHRRWLILDSPTLHGVRSRSEDISTDQKIQIAEFLTALACSDGEIDSQEIDELSNIYSVMELEEGMVHRHIHQLQTQTEPDDEPVTVRESNQISEEYEIPAPEQPTSTGTSGVTLNQERLAETFKDTQEVRGFLTNVFEDEYNVQQEPSEPEPASGPDQHTERNLSEEHRQFLIDISEKSQWERKEVEELARERNLLLGAAIESINDYAFEQIETPIIEGTDELFVDQELANEILQ